VLEQCVELRRGEGYRPIDARSSLFRPIGDVGLGLMERWILAEAAAIAAIAVCLRRRLGGGRDIAVVYGASSGWSEELFVVDFDAVLYHGGFFADLATRLKELAKACRAQGYFVLAPGALTRHIEPHGVMAIEIPAWLDPAETLLFAAACIKSGRVRFCPPTIDKMAIHPWARR
jgi:hypothetical protein